MTILAQPATASTASSTAAPAAAPTARRDVHAWGAEVRRTLRPAAVEVVDGSAAQRQRLVATGLRRGTLRLPAGAARGGDLSAVPLRDLLPREHRDLLDAGPAAVPPASSPAGEGARRAQAMRQLSGASRGRTAWLVPHAVVQDGVPGAALSVLFTDSLVAVLALLDVAEVGAGPLQRVEAGEPWSAAVHSMGLPLDDEHGLPLRDDVPWPTGRAFSTSVRGGTEVWSCGSPVPVV